MNPFHYDTSRQPKKGLVTWLMRIALAVGCLFTGMHNYALYLRGLSGVINPNWRVFAAFLIAFILEAAFYFSFEGRGQVFVTDEQRTASAYGALTIFLVILANTITDHAMNVGRVREGDWLAWWASYGAAGMIVAVVGYIGYLKANAPEALLASEAAKAEAARVRAVQQVQTEILTDPAVLDGYRAQARRWALGVVDQQQVLPPPRRPATYVNGEDEQFPN